MMTTAMGGITTEITGAITTMIGVGMSVMTVDATDAATTVIATTTD